MSNNEKCYRVQVIEAGAVVRENEVTAASFEHAARLVLGDSDIVRGQPGLRLQLRAKVYLTDASVGTTTLVKFYHHPG